MRTLQNWYTNLKFQTKVMLLLNFLILIIFIALSFYIHSIIAQNIQEEVGKKALATSTTISNSPTIINAFDEEDPSAQIQAYTKSIQDKIDAEFIVIGNQDEIRYAHPLEDRIGKQMVGDDNERALQKGESYVSRSKGSIGLSIRGKTPIIKDGEIVGVVSVGYLLDDINTLVLQKNKPILFLFVVFLIIGMFGSKFIASHLKKELHDMEPKEIAALLLQKDVILQSVKEGIIVVDNKNRITLINQSAKDILHVATDITDTPIKKTIGFPLLEYAKAGNITQDMEYILKNEVVLMNILPLKKDMYLYGAVMTFRRKNDLEKVTKELNSIKQYSEGLRAQTHEFSNKIHTLYGLLQLQHYQAAKEFIEEEVNTSSHYYPSLREYIKDPVIQGLLIAKYNIANEKGIRLDISQESSLEVLTNESLRHVVLMTLGNLIDNAFTAVTKVKNPTVQLLLTDIGKNIVIEIDDNGPGISKEIIPKLFDDGITTKEEKDHGKGMYMIKQALDSINGSIMLEDSELSGTCFIALIPKEEQDL